MTVLCLPTKASPAPYAAMIVQCMLGLSTGSPAAADAVQLKLKDNSTIQGLVPVCRAMVRSVYPRSALCGSDALSATQIDHWLDFYQNRMQKLNDFKELREVMQELNHYLKMRTFLVSYQLTLADLIVWGALRSSNIWLKISKTKEAPVNLLRWYQHIGVQPHVQAVLATASSRPSTPRTAGAPAKDSGKKESSKTTDQGSFDIDLPGAAKGQVVTRFPPEPSGYLHIGHAKAALLNQYFAQKFEGRLIIRFDDTNPSKEKVEFEESILADLKLLEIKGDMLTWTSDYFDQIYDLAIQLIKKGEAYCDNTPQEQMRKERMDGIASQNRDLSVEENLRLFEEMKKNTETGLTYCLRAKMSVDAKNKALRDPVIYRCNPLPHNRTGGKWKIYPTYDFACPIVDSVEGVTHALRTNEYHDRNDQYYWFIDHLGLRKPHIWDYSRVNFVYTLLSKRKLQWFVDQGFVNGWDDPRFPTVRGILRRGMTVEALKRYILMQGASKNTILLEWDKLWTINKQIIDPVAPRFCGLNKKNLCKVTLLDGPESPYEKGIPKHKKNPELGEKQTLFGKVVLLDADDASGLVDGEEVTLMDWGNVIIKKVHKNTDGVVDNVEATLHLEGDFKKTKKKLTWLADTDKLTPLELLDYDFLITKKKMEEEDNFSDFINPATETKIEAVGDQNLKTVKKGTILQLERRGYYICDSEWSETQPCKLILIPDGRAASSSLKYDPKKK